MKKNRSSSQGGVEFDETYILDCHKEALVPKKAGCPACKHGTKAARPGISSEYVAICTGVQRDGNIVAETVNRAKPSAEELSSIFSGHIAAGTLALTDGLRSYHVLESLTNCTVVDVTREGTQGWFDLNTVNCLHSFIKVTYKQYRGVATKYINRYNALFSIAFRCVNEWKDKLFSSFCTPGQGCYWHGVKDIQNYRLVEL